MEGCGFAFFATFYKMIVLTNCSAVLESGGFLAVVCLQVDF